MTTCRDETALKAHPLVHARQCRLVDVNPRDRTARRELGGDGSAQVGQHEDGADDRGEEEQASQAQNRSAYWLTPGMIIRWPFRPFMMHTTCRIRKPNPMSGAKIATIHPRNDPRMTVRI